MQRQRTVDIPKMCLGPISAYSIPHYYHNVIPHPTPPDPTETRIIKGFKPLRRGHYKGQKLMINDCCPQPVEVPILL